MIAINNRDPDGVIFMIKNIFCFTLLLSFLAACGTTEEKQELPTVEDRSDAIGDQQGAGVRTFGTDNNRSSDISELDDPASPLSVRVIYFDFDSSEVLPAYREVVEAHGTYLAQNPQVTVALEGHTDERGSREYNLALGERRAQSVKRHMMVFGPSSSQIRTTSYGEERPVAEGHNEQAWSQNRRVEILY